MKRQVMFLIAICCLLVTGAAAQYTPVTAKQRTVSQHISADGKVLSQTTVEQFYQNSAGSILTQYLVEREGKLVPESANLFDYGNTRKFYHIVYGSKEALEIQCLTGHPESRANIPQAASLGEEYIQGVRTVAIPTRAKINGQMQETGKAWISPDFPMLVLKEDSMQSLPNGAHRHITKETLEIKVSEEPPAGLFQIDKSFNVMTRSQAMSCKKP